MTARDLSTLPKSWELVEFQQIGDFLRGPFGSSIKKSVCVGKAPETFKVYEQGNVIQNNFKKGSYYITKKRFEELKKFELLAGDVVITCAGTRGPGAVVPKGIEKGIINSVLMRIRLNNTRVLTKYFLYYFQSLEVQARILSRSPGATIKNLFATKTLRSFNIPLPPLRVQKGIVAILGKTDFIKEKRKRADELTDTIIQSVFHKMFNPDRAERENWKIWSVEDLAIPAKGAIQSGPFGSDLHNRDFVKEGVLAVGIDNVYPNMFAAGRGRHITKEKYNGLIKFTARPGDVLITVMGTIGRSCVFPASATPAIITKHVYRISLDRTKCLPEFLSSSINWDMEIRRQLGASTTGAIVDGLTSKSIKSLEVRLPPFPEQLRFVNLLGGYDKIQPYQQEQAREIGELFDSLMRKAFRGELVTENKKSFEEIHLANL